MADYYDDPTKLITKTSICGTQAGKQLLAQRQVDNHEHDFEYTERCGILVSSISNNINA